MEIDPADLAHADQSQMGLDIATNELLDSIRAQRMMGEGDEMRLTFDTINRIDEIFRELPEEFRLASLQAAHARALVRWSREA